MYSYENIQDLIHRRESIQELVQKLFRAEKRFSFFALIKDSFIIPSPTHQIYNAALGSSY